MALILEQTCVASDLVDAALISNGTDTGTALIKTVLDILEDTVSDVDGLNKRYWATEIHKLTNRAILAGPRISILLAWATDMCESGTITEPNPADSTVRSYIRRALMPLHGLLLSLPEDMEKEEWRAPALYDRYQQLVETQTSGNQPTMRSALSNFHYFLVNWFDLEPLTAPLQGAETSAPVKAQAIHRHERDLAMLWAATHDDSDLGLGAQLILSIAYETPARAQELMRLRIANVLWGSDHKGKFVEIEIARDATSGRLKTPSSQRRLLIRCSEVMALLEKWIQRRRMQGATQSAFLFGDRSDDGQRYRPAATLAFSNRLLKIATGDPSVSFHALRHTAISNLVGDVLSTTSELDINRIEVIAAQAGHASGMTTLEVYTHVYERAVRTWLDQSLVSRIELSSDDAADLLNLKPPTLRKMASRATLDVNTFAWGLLSQASKDICAQPASIGYQWCIPACPVFGAASERQLTAGVMAAVLAEALKGTPNDTLAHRFMLCEGALEDTLSKLTQDCSAHAMRVFPRKSLLKTGVSPDLPSVLSKLGIDFDRRNQTKYQSLASALDGEIDDAVLLRGLKSWERCYQGTYLTLANPSEALGMFTLLKHGGVDPTAMRVCVQTASEGRSKSKDRNQQSIPLSPIEDIQSQLLARNIAKTFSAIFGLSPNLTPVKVNSDIPAAYLRWDSNLREGAAAGTTAGLSAFMICVKAYLLYKEAIV